VFLLKIEYIKQNLQYSNYNTNNNIEIVTQTILKRTCPQCKYRVIHKLWTLL